jgi:microcystin-dependent protein
MATVTPGIVWTSGETVTPAKLNAAAAPTVAVADGEVTVAKLAAAVQQLLVPAGAVQAFAMNSAPTGWLAADGTAVSRTDYAALFTAIGTTYGVGDGSTTFALPDLRGIFVRGSGSQTIDSITYNKTFAAKETDDLKAHTHTVGGSTVVTYNAGDFPLTVFSGGDTNSGSAGGTETRPANIALLYCIKF